MEGHSLKGLHGAVAECPFAGAVRTARRGTPLGWGKFVGAGWCGRRWLVGSGGAFVGLCSGVGVGWHGGVGWFVWWGEFGRVLRGGGG